MWETVGHHKALVDNKELYSLMGKSIGESAAKIEFVQHTHLSTPAPEDALKAPITEFVIFTLNEGTDVEEFKGVLSKFVAPILATDAVKNRGGWGPIVEDERKFAIVLGWDSKEVRNWLYNFVNVMGVLTGHEQQEFEKVFASVPPEVLEGRKKLGALSDIDLKLTVLKKYQNK